MTSSVRASFQLRRRATVPVTNSVRRVYDLIRSSVQGDGALRLVEDELMTALAASRAAVRAALQRLASEGAVDRSPRVGTIAAAVTALPLAAVTTLSTAGASGLELRRLEARAMAAPPVMRERLELDIGAPMALVELVVLRDDEPLGLLTSYVGLPSHSAATDVIGADPIALLRSCLEVRAGGVASAIGARPADIETAGLLAVAPGSALLWCDEVVRAADGRARAVCHWSLRGDRVVLTSSDTPA